jgi:kynurenine formamidase
LKKVADQIAGYASINYRLSQHSEFPQDKSKTSDLEMREAKHPNHINDVLTALKDLQQRHKFGERYLLLGHGCGATMAMQVAMSRNWTRSGPVMKNSDIQPPIAILGIDAIYDIPLSRNRNIGLQKYQPLIEGAFGNDEQVWAAASPATWTKYAETWKEGRSIMLVHSREDEMIDWSQVEAMEKCWSENQEWGSNKIEMKIQEIKGRHAEIWQKGVGMAGPIAEAIMSLQLDRDDSA